MSRIGFIGLGIMGEPMCRNLLKAGHSLTVYNRSTAPIERLAEHGAARGNSIREVVERSEIVITMLPDGPEVESVILGVEGVVECARTGTAVVDMSSVSPMVSQAVGAACAAKGLRFLDAPVSGGQPKAIDGTLAIMVGGDEDVFRELMTVLQAMGSSVTLCGPVGAGNVTKLANQIMVACNIAAMGEALVLAKRAGLDPNIVVNAVKNGLAGSAVLQTKAPLLAERRFEPGFRIRLHQKDLRNALLAGEAMKVGLPLTAMVQQMLIALMNQGKGELDHGAIVLFLEQMASVEVTAGIGEQA